MKRIAVVDHSKVKNKPEHARIIDVCPINRAGNPCMYLTVDGKVGIDEALCIGCGICVNQDPFKAIKIINLPEILDREPIHRYGKNSFALYSLPTPIFGKVLGILGVNGIGKSTALKIISGLIKANLGSETEVEFDSLIKYFKGSEAQKFFEGLRDKKIKVSYKPQSVDLIPKQIKGSVRELLIKSDQKNLFNKIVEELDLNQILDNDISKISGGELQRVAIAATALKEANLYVFDEPSSFLDIKQRISISKFIRSMANENTAVIVVEHDLIILDYMTDIIQIMYGSEGVFGALSLPRPTRTAMNVYLDGYIKEENIRFRDHKISFQESTIVREPSRDLLSSWENVEKKLGKFKLTSEIGKINRREVIGVLGENGIGKTSFVKLLAKVDNPDKGYINEDIKVSYKPQHIQTDSEVLVINVLANTFKNFDVQLVRPLNLVDLMYKRICDLSGGELQRVAIANCLSQDAKLFLLDEPSAFLDVEQRLKVAKVIVDFMEQSGKSAIVVDHDLLFIDYLSQKLMVFDGVPAIEGCAKGPFEMKEGMNLFLNELGITLRRDEESHRPRINKLDSVKDKEQKNSGKYYYT